MKITILGNFYQQGMNGNIICVTAIDIKSHLFTPIEERIC